jgi:hypothetical protein
MMTPMTSSTKCSWLNSVYVVEGGMAKIAENKIQGRDNLADINPIQPLYRCLYLYKVVLVLLLVQ